MTDLRPGDTVRLWTENERLNDCLATVESLESWGAHVVSVAPAWPGSTSNRYRAAWDELVPVREPATAPPARVADTRNRAGERAREEGYSGEVCDVCGSLAVKRVGTCTVCTDCGSSGGCG